MNPASVVQRLKQRIESASARLVGRRDLVELVFLALVAREHVLFVGPPGTGKSAAVRLAAEGVSARYFEYLIGRFTEPSEIFGPLDLEALRQGRLRPDVSGMLPEAELAFLDEIFLGSTAILNALLTLLNERRYRRGHFTVEAPLRCCVAASNALPDEPMLQAFADRFLVTAFVEPVGDHALESLLDRGWQGARGGLVGPDPEGGAPPLAMAEIDLLSEGIAAVGLGEVRGAYAHLVRKLRARSVPLSDRRIVKGQKLVAAAALAAGRDRAEAADLWPVLYLVQDRAVQDEVRDLLRAELGASASPAFPEAVKAASHGPQARAGELAAYGAGLAAAMPPTRGGEAFETWLVRAESFLAQIDAGFAPDRIPEDLAACRAALVAQVAPPAPGPAAPPSPIPPAAPPPGPKGPWGERPAPDGAG